MRTINSNKEFDQAIASKKPVLVDFHAEWCGPCKMIAPQVEKIAANYPEQLDVIKVDADEFQETMTKYAVRGIPTLMIFKDGIPQATKVGVASLKQLESFVADYL